MKGKLVKLFSLLACGLLAVGLSACGNNNVTSSSQNTSVQSYFESLHFQKIAGKEEYCVVGLGTISDLDIVIPASYRGLPVTEIGDTAFFPKDPQYNTNPPEGKILSITIPNSVTSIGYRAFGRCKSLTNITIPDSVTSIGGWAFQGCSSLTSITIPDSVTEIGSHAFLGCSSLTEIQFEGTVDEWNALSYDWDGVPANKVICSDGEVAL